MSEILRAEGLQKTFRLSAKQQKLERPDPGPRLPVRVCPSPFRREILASWDPMAQVKPRPAVLATLIKPDQGMPHRWLQVSPGSLREVRKRVGFHQ